MGDKSYNTMGRVDKRKAEEAMVKLSKRVMRKLRNRYNLENRNRNILSRSSNRGTSAARIDGMAEERGAGSEDSRRINRRRREMDQGIPPRIKRVEDTNEEENKEETAKKEENKRQQKENGLNSWKGRQDWPEWEKDQKKAKIEQLKRGREWNKTEETADPARRKKRARSSEI